MPRRHFAQGTLSRVCAFACCLLPVENAICQLQLPAPNEQPFPVFMELQEPDSTLTFVSVDNYPSDIHDDFHTDARVLTVAGISTSGKSNLVLQVIASKIGSAANFNSVLSSTKERRAQAVSLAGLPGTRLEITGLASPLRFFNREWRPRSPGSSFIIVAQKKVIGVNVEATPFPKAATSSSRILTTAEFNDTIARSTSKPPAQSPQLSTSPPPSSGGVTQEGKPDEWYDRGLKLLKGDGSDEEKIEAYRCLHIAAERGFTKAIAARFELGSAMRLAQVAEAKRRASFSGFKTTD